MRKSFVLTLALSILIPLSASADQFGMLYGFITTPSGSTKLYSNKSAEALKSYQAPHGFFFGLENLRVGYLEYQMMASDGDGNWSPANRVVDVQILSFEYQEVFPEGYYYHVGLANFTSQVTYQYHKVYTTADDYGTEAQGTTNKIIDPGLIVGGGIQKEYGKGFLGADFTMIPSKTVTYEYEDHSWSSIKTLLEDGEDLGVTIVALFIGMNF